MIRDAFVAEKFVPVHGNWLKFKESNNYSTKDAFT